MKWIDWYPYTIVIHNKYYEVIEINRESNASGISLKILLKKKIQKKRMDKTIPEIRFSLTWMKCSSNEPYGL